MTVKPLQTIRSGNSFAMFWKTTERNSNSVE